MPFCSRYNCLFIHIPRTGGTTIEKILGIHREWPTLDLDVLHGALVIGEEEYQLQHLSFLEASQFITKATGSTFAFTFVRNPWDRLISEYFWQGAAGEDFDTFVERACDIVIYRRELEGRNCHLRPQVEFLSEKISYVGRFEKFATDLRTVLSALRVVSHDIPHEYKTAHQHYSKYYSDRSRERVASVYESDIASLKYNFEPG